jgi:NADH dehydrogenase
VILLTGATGFVGRHVAHELRARGRQVRCLVRSRRRAGRLESWGCELVEGDVTASAALGPAVAGCDTIVHLVAILAGSREEFERVMEQATRDLVAAALEGGVQRIVLMSALGTNEETKDLVPYYHAKWEMEQTVQASGIDHVVFRPSFIFGADGGLLPTLVRQVRYLPVAPVPGPGRQRIQPISVDDVARFFAEAVDREPAASRLFDLGGPDVVTWNELVDRIKRVLGTRRPRVNVPLGLLRAGAVFAERLPHPPVTRDQLKMLTAGDNVCDMTPALETFGGSLASLDEQLRRAV